MHPHVRLSVKLAQRRPPVSGFRSGFKIREPPLPPWQAPKTRKLGIFWRILAPGGPGGMPRGILRSGGFGCTRFRAIWLVPDLVCAKNCIFWTFPNLFKQPDELLEAAEQLQAA